MINKENSFGVWRISPLNSVRDIRISKMALDKAMGLMGIKRKLRAARKRLLNR